MQDTRAVVTGFLNEVRSGRDPDAAERYFAPRVLAHQLVAEAPYALERSPADYAAHIREFLRDYGAFELRVDELLVDGDKAYARWTQIGRDLAGSGETVRQIGSACYRVADGRIVEYWIQSS